MTKTKFNRKRVMLFLIMLSLVLSSGTFAYWANFVEGTSSNAVSSLEIGSGKNVQTVFNMENKFNSGGLLVPADQLNNSLEGAVDQINLSYTLRWLEDVEIMSQLDGTTTTGDIHIYHSFTITSDGEELDQETYQYVYDLFHIEYNKYNPTFLTLDGESVDFNFTITMDEPQNQLVYNLVKDSLINIIFTYEIDTDSIQVIDNDSNDIINDGPFNGNNDSNEEETPTGPYIELTGGNEITWELGEDFVDPGYKAYDSLGNEISNVYFSGSYNAWALGTFELTYGCYSSTDQVSCEPVTRTVTVIDTTAPEIHTSYEHISIPAGNYGWLTSEYLSTIYQSAAWSTDASNNVGEITVSGFESFNLQTPGIYIITFTATDGSGNVGTHETTFTVY